MHILHAHSKGGMGIRDEIIAFCDGSGIAPFVIDLDEEFEIDSSDDEDSAIEETSNSIITRRGLADKLDIHRRIQSELNYDLSIYESQWNSLSLQKQQQ